MDLTEELCLAMKRSGGRGCLVDVTDSRGSVPRSAGAWMAVLPEPLGGRPRTIGTIGGGHLEWSAISQALELLALGSAWQEPVTRRVVLGPSVGQCCGGAVQLRWRPLLWADMERWQKELAQPRIPVALFGAGHVAQALVQVLQTLPCNVQWFDSRENVWDGQRWPSQVQFQSLQWVQDGVEDVQPGAQVFIFTHSHEEDLHILHACLLRQRAKQDLPCIGLIGSATKWASFRSRLRARGISEDELAQVICPIGVPGVQGKEPQVIAVAVAAQILQRR